MHPARDTDLAKVLGVIDTLPSMKDRALVLRFIVNLNPALIHSAPLSGWLNANAHELYEQVVKFR